MSGSPQHLGRTTSSKDSPDRDAVPGLHIIIGFPYTGRGKGGRGRKRPGFSDSHHREQALQPKPEAISSARCGSFREPRASDGQF